MRILKQNARQKGSGKNAAGTQPLLTVMRPAVAILSTWYPVVARRRGLVASMVGRARIGRDRIIE
jgi:hypothetical protein